MPSSACQFIYFFPLLFQELNAVYNLSAEQDQSQLLHKIIQESYTAGQLQHNYLYDQQVRVTGQRPVMVRDQSWSETSHGQCPVMVRY